MAVTVIPFDSGQHQGISKNLLPTGQFALLQNGQLDRDGRIRTRPGFTQVASTTYGSGAFVGYDLFSYNDRLMALGDRLAKSFPTDVFEYTQGAGAAAWRPTDPDSTHMRLPRATKVRDLGSPPEQDGNCTNFGCAASAGFVTLVYNTNDSQLTGYGHVFRAATDQTFCLQRFAGSLNDPQLSLRAVALSDRVWVLGTGTAGDTLKAKLFVYETDEVFQTSIELLSAATGSTVITYAAAKVSGSDDFVTCTARLTNNVIQPRRWTSAGVDSGVTYAQFNAGALATSVAIEADVTSNTLTIVYTLVGGTANVKSYNLTTGAQIGAGPFTPPGTSGETAVRTSLVRRSASTVTILCDITTDPAPSITFDDYNPATNAFTNQDILRDAQMASSPIVHADQVCVAIRYGAANRHESLNLLLSFGHGNQDNVVTPLIGKDLEIADSSSTLLPDVCVDTSVTPNKYYWANGVINTGEARPGGVNNSVDVLPLVTEFLLGSTDRRQISQLGNVAYIAGGCPTLFDGRQVFETGYHARPRIISGGPVLFTGNLLIGAEYDYRLVWEALDSDRNVHRSSVSKIFTTKQGAAKVTGTKSINPPDGTLAATGFHVIDSAGTDYNVTFPAVTTRDDVVNHINSITGATIRASVDGLDRLVLTSTATGTSALINLVGGGSSYTILGLTAGSTNGNTQPTNSLVCSSPHSMRCNVGVFNAGGAVRLKLYRTLATVTNTPVVLTGTQPAASPPSSSIVGSSLKWNIVDSAGASFVTINFLAGDVTPALIVARINAGAGGRLVASDAGGAIRLTTVESGSGVSLQILTTLASSVLGFTTGTMTFGTTVFTKGENFQLCAVGHIGPNSRTGLYVTIVDKLSDDDLASQELLYTAVESPLGHHAPPPHDYVWSGKERLNTGGQPKGDRWTVSKLLTQANPACFAIEGTTGFSNRLVANIEGVLVEGDSSTYFTRRKIWRVSGRGPELNGVGEFFAADEVESAGGMRVGGWRSLCKTPEGTFFQLADDKLYMLKPGGSPEWIGQEVRDTLTLYPNIVAAEHFTQRQAVVFACQNAVGDAGALLVYDLRRKVWGQDTIGPVSALAEFDGRIAYIQGGNVFIEDLLPGVGTYVPLTVTLGSFIGFGPMGWGAIQKVLLLGVYRGDVNIEAQISYDDGKTWLTLGNFDVTAANGYALNQPIQLEFVPAIQDCSRFALQFLETYAGTGSEGAWLNALELHHSQNPGSNKLGSAYTR